MASTATSKAKIPKDTYRCSWKGRERVGSKKVMVLGHKGGAWGKCRRGWSDVAGARGFNPNGATVLGTKRRNSNLQISHQDRNDSSERSFRGIERGQSHRVTKGLKAPLLCWLQPTALWKRSDIKSTMFLDPCQGTPLSSPAPCDTTVMGAA